MTATATACVFHGAGQPLRMQSLPLPHLKAGEALVKMRLATICGSDLHTVSGRRDTPTPCILGHEMVGEIVGLGSPAPLAMDSHALHIGDRVVWSVMASCGTCFFCTHDLPQKCEKLLKYGHHPIGPGDDYQLTGGLATHCHLAPGTGIARVPEGLDDTIVCPSSCATATVVSGLRQLGDVTGQCVLILGAGMLGVTACAYANSLGAGQVIACDLDPARLETARQFGATHVYQMSQGDTALRELAGRLTSGRGVDFAIDLTGNPDAIASGLACLRIGGKYLWQGAVFPTLPVPMFPEQVVRRQLTILGSHNYHPRDLQTAVDWLAENQSRFPLRQLVGRTFPLSQWEQAFDLARTGTFCRVGLTPE